MISAQDWWNVFTGYNRALYPFQWIIMAAAFALVIWLCIRPSDISSKVMMFFLSLSNIWNGTMFFIVIGTGLPSPLRFIQGGLFIVIGILLLIDAIKGKTALRLPESTLLRNLTLALMLLIASYPFIGLLRGHSVLQLVYPGTLPCATASLTLLLLSTALPKTNKPAYILLLVWAIPFAPLIQIPVFTVYEDLIMFIIGIYALIRLLFTYAKSKRKS